MNRDYFTRPVQGSRSAYDYGRSNAPFEREPYRRTSWRKTLATALVVMALVILAITR